MRSIRLSQLIFNKIMEYHKSLSLDQSFIACFWNPYVRSVDNKDCLKTYADDNQVYMVINPDATRATIAARLEACLSDISDWMTTNILKINQDETELIIFSPKNKPGVILDRTINFDDQIIEASSSVKNLYFWYGRPKILISKQCFNKLFKIGSIRELITENTFKVLVCSFVTSRLDYGNALLYG